MIPLEALFQRDIGYDSFARLRRIVPCTRVVTVALIGCGQILRQIMTGTIRTLRTDKGFGFIKDAAGQEYFFHQSAVQGEGIGDLREGDSVEFEVGQGPKGPRAEGVRRTST